jgi:hypothetical protein
MAKVKSWTSGAVGEPAFPADFEVVKKAVLQVTDIKTNRNKYYALELLRALGDPHPVTRARAAARLGWRRSAEAVPLLLERLGSAVDDACDEGLRLLAVGQTDNPNAQGAGVSPASHLRGRVEFAYMVDPGRAPALRAAVSLALRSGSSRAAGRSGRVPMRLAPAPRRDPSGVRDTPPCAAPSDTSCPIEDLAWSSEVTVALRTSVRQPRSDFGRSDRRAQVTVTCPPPRTGPA